MRVSPALLAACLIVAAPAAAARAASTQRVSVGSLGEQGNRSSGEYGGIALSGHARTVAFASSASNLVPGDANGREDVFVRDIHSRRTSLVSADGQPRPTNGLAVSGVTLSRDGRTVT